MMSTGGDSSGFGGLGGNASGLDGAAHGGGGRVEARSSAPPGVLSVIVGLPFRLLGKVRCGAVSDAVSGVARRKLRLGPAFGKNG